MPNGAISICVLMLVPVLMLMPMPMPMPVLVPDRGATIGTCFWLERRLYSAHTQSEPAHHRVQHMIMQPAQPPWLDLQRHMTVAEMVGGAHKQQRVVRLGTGNRLGGGSNLDDLALLVGEQITIAQALTTWQQDTDLTAIIEPRTQARA